MTANTEPRHTIDGLPPAAHVVLDRVHTHPGSTAHAIADATALGYETVAAALRASNTQDSPTASKAKQGARRATTAGTPHPSSPNRQRSAQRTAVLRDTADTG
jgi:hypothetical protein